MIVYNKPPIPVDVDETLVKWHGTSYIPMKKNIESLIRHANRGHMVIVWSKGGWEWAARVVRELGLESYVTMVMDKPWFYLDDKPADTWMERYWYSEGEEDGGKTKDVNTNTKEPGVNGQGRADMASAPDPVYNVLYPFPTEKSNKTKG